MPGTEGASYPFWSPDGRTVGFFADGKLKRVELAGGLPRTLADASNRGGSWSPDGTILFARTSASGLFRIAASGGEPTPVTTLEKQNSHRFPQFLPGFRQFIFYAQGTAETAGIYLGSLDSAKTQRLIAVDSNAAVGPNGWVLLYPRRSPSGSASRCEERRTPRRSCDRGGCRRIRQHLWRRIFCVVLRLGGVPPGRGCAPPVDMVRPLRKDARNHGST